MRKSALNVKIIGLIIPFVLIVSAAIASMSIKSSPPYGGQQYFFAVDPPYYNATDAGKTVGDTFTINVNVSVDNMYGYEFQLFWNRTLINCTAAVDYPPFSAYFPAGPGLEWDYNTTHGRYFRGMTCTNPGPPPETFSGKTTVATLTFEIMYQPYSPMEPDMSTPLDLYNTKLSNPAGQPITHDTYDGLYEILALIVPPPTLEVVPSYATGRIENGSGENVTVDIVIKDLDVRWELYGWEIKLGYNTELLNATDAVEGPFLPGFAGPSGTYFVANYGDDYCQPDTTCEAMGLVLLAGTLLDGGYTVPYGSGTLATVTFKAILPGGTVLDLYDTKLSNNASQPLSHDTVDGYVELIETIDHPIDFDGVTYHVITESNSSVSPVPMFFSQPNEMLSFIVTGQIGATGFCNVTIPNNFLWATPTAPWVVLVDSINITYTWTENATHTSLYFTYEFQSIHTVAIMGTGVVPEFPIAIVVPLLLIATMLATIFGKKVRSGKRKGLAVAG